LPDNTPDDTIAQIAHPNSLQAEFKISRSFIKLNIPIECQLIREVDKRSLVHLTQYLMWLAFGKASTEQDILPTAKTLFFSYSAWHSFQISFDNTTIPPTETTELSKSTQNSMKAPSTDTFKPEISTKLSQECQVETISEIPIFGSEKTDMSLKRLPESPADDQELVKRRILYDKLQKPLTSKQKRRLL
jgi:hypothetical protein